MSDDSVAFVLRSAVEQSAVAQVTVRVVNVNDPPSLVSPGNMTFTPSLSGSTNLKAVGRGLQIIDPDLGIGYWMVSLQVHHGRFASVRHGNVLNENTARAGARGVRLDGLDKARAVKSAEGQTSLLEHACAAAKLPLEQLQIELSTVRLAIQMPLPEVLRFVKEVEDSVDAISQELALCPIPDLEADVAAGAQQSLEAPETAPNETDGIAATQKAAAAAAAKVAGALAARRGESPDEQQLALRFRWVMEPFLIEMRSGLTELTTRRAETSALLRKLAVWLGEDPAQANPDAMLTACAELVDTATAMAIRPDPVAGSESARAESATQDVAEPEEVDEHADEYF